MNDCVSILTSLMNRTPVCVPARRGGLHRPPRRRAVAEAAAPRRRLSLLDTSKASRRRRNTVKIRTVKEENLCFLPLQFFFGNLILHTYMLIICQVIKFA